jgi:DNA-directed RNA polymerase specialized sigma24 family protein
VEEVSQDAWMKAYLHLNTLDDSAKFATWLTRIAINSSLVILRRKRSHPEISLEITDSDTWQHRDIADQAKNAEELYARHERVELLRREICCLCPLCELWLKRRSKFEAMDPDAQQVWRIAQTSALVLAFNVFA